MKQTHTSSTRRVSQSRATCNRKAKGSGAEVLTAGGASPVWLSRLCVVGLGECCLNGPV